LFSGKYRTAKVSNMSAKPRLLTRQQLAVFLREEKGFPIGKSTLNKLCSPAINQGPRACAMWGRRPLYDPEEGIAWAEARLRPVGA
jgi:hypothetical protein